MASGTKERKSVVTVLVALGLGVILGAVGVLAALAAGWFDPTAVVKSKEWGEFPSAPRAELLDDGRQLRLLEDFAYIDPRGRAWVALKDEVVDGASIPRVFWTITGGPLEGKYRNASIVHDAGCVRMAEPWEDVHLMFYEACRCGGVPESQAKVLYAAVYHFGPRWELRTVSETREVVDPDGQHRMMTVQREVADLVRATQEPNADVGEKFKRYIEQNNPSLDELTRLDPRTL